MGIKIDSFIQYDTLQTDLDNQFSIVKNGNILVEDQKLILMVNGILIKKMMSDLYKTKIPLFNYSDIVNSFVEDSFSTAIDLIGISYDENQSHIYGTYVAFNIVN